MLLVHSFLFVCLFFFLFVFFVRFLLLLESGLPAVCDCSIPWTFFSTCIIIFGVQKVLLRVGVYDRPGVPGPVSVIFSFSLHLLSFPSVYSVQQT